MHYSLAQFIGLISDYLPLKKKRVQFTQQSISIQNFTYSNVYSIGNGDLNALELNMITLVISSIGVHLWLLCLNRKG